MTLLRQRMDDDLQLRNYSDRTIKAYLRCVSNFALHFGKSPDELGPGQIREYQLYLVKQKQCSWAVFNQTVCALRFFYNTTLGYKEMIEEIPYPRFEKRLPVVLSQTEANQLSPLALQNKRVIYGLLFQAASETLLKIAGDPKHLGAVIGFLAVLHTWGQTLQHHPHLLFASSEWLRHNLGIKSSAVQINLLEIHQHYCATLDVAIGTDAGCHPEMSRFQHGTRY